MQRRPLAVTLVAWLFVVAGAVGLAYHAADLLPPWRGDALWVAGVRLAAVVIGIGLLRAARWARWGALAWMAGHVALSWWHTPFELLVHAALLALIAWGLFRLPAKEFFARR